MFWDKVAGVYDLFGNIYNGKVDRQMCRLIADQLSAEDDVLECACGTGMISVYIAPACRRLVATDFSDGMLKRARKKCAGFSNIVVQKADILDLDFADDQFDVVVAANVLHLLDEPYKALSELDRVCRPGGKLILPTYVNKSKAHALDKTLDKAGADFKQDFTYDTYQRFFVHAGYKNIQTTLIDGRVPCAAAVITKQG